MKLLRLAILLVLAPFICKSQDANIVNVGRTDSVWSATLKEKRKFFVYTPPSFNNNVFAKQSYPVLYLLDGDAHFLSVSGIVQFLAANALIPEMIVVAIPNTDRTRDLTPSVFADGAGKPIEGFSKSGGMQNFLSFIKNELIPHVDSVYHTQPFRIFVGHSLGGITVINALYTIPETFNAYIAIDPSLWYDNQLLLKKTKNYFSQASLKNKFLYLGQANTLHPGDTTRNLHFESIMQFNSTMGTFNNSGIHYSYKYYPNDDHGSVPMITTYDGLRFIFDGYKPQFIKVSSDPAALKEHYEKVSAAMGSRFLPSESFVNSMGYQMLQEDTVKAIAFFQMNIDLYPDSYNVYDSMGEVWMDKGDYKKAIDYYEKSLALNPKNENARDRIKKMKEKKN